MSFAGSNGSRSRSASRSPYHERAKASSSSSRSPGPPPHPKSQSFFISVQQRAMRPETAAAVPRNLLYSNQSPARSPSKGAQLPALPLLLPCWCRSSSPQPEETFPKLLCCFQGSLSSSCTTSFVTTESCAFCSKAGCERTKHSNKELRSPSRECVFCCTS